MFYIYFYRMKKWNFILTFWLCCKIFHNLWVTYDFSFSFLKAMIFIAFKCRSKIFRNKISEIKFSIPIFNINDFPCKSDEIYFYIYCTTIPHFVNNMWCHFRNSLKIKICYFCNTWLKYFINKLMTFAQKIIIIMFSLIISPYFF